MKRLLKILICLFVVQNLYAQNISENWTKYESAYPENVFVHTDAVHYLNNENIWFTAFVVNTITYQLSELSSSLYIELVDESGSSKIKQRLPIEGGRASGSIEIPYNFTSGHYQLIAYTQWMRNFGKEFCFSKPLRIINPFAILDQKEVNGRNEVVLVEKPIYQDGNLKKELIVFDQESADISYSISVGDSGKTAMERNADGYTVVLDNSHKNPTLFDSDNKVDYIHISYSVGLVINNKEFEVTATVGESGKYYLVIHKQGLVQHSENIQSEGGYLYTKIPFSNMSSGINELVIFHWKIHKNLLS